MNSQLPISIKINNHLTEQFAKLKSLVNKLEAQFNFQTMTAGWYGDEENIVEICFSLESPQSFEQAISKSLFSDKLTLADDVISFYDSSTNLRICFVAITERAQMLQWQSWLADADISTKTMLPDVLAMPYVDQQWSAIALHGSRSSTSAASSEQIVIRQGQWQGFTLDADAWQFTLQQRLLAQQSVDSEQQDHTLTINAYSKLPFVDELVDDLTGELNNQDSITVIKAEEELPLALFAQHSAQHGKPSDFNLLQGEFKIKERRSKNLNHWLWAAGVAACALLLNMSYKGAQLWQLSSEQAQVEAQIIAQYKKAFPQAKRVRIGTIKSQLNRQMSQLRGGDEQVSFLAMLSQVQPAFAKVSNLKPESLKFDGKRQELRLQAIADDYQHFDRFKNALNSQAFTVKQGAQNNQGDQVTGSFSIISKQRGKEGGS